MLQNRFRTIPRKILISLSSLLLIFLSVLPASAHRINLFCKVKKDRVSCSSSFSDGTPARDAKTKVFSQKGHKLLLSGKTDKNGNFEFKIPSRIQNEDSDIKVIVQASMGHRDSWIISARELSTPENTQNKQTPETKRERISSTIQSEAAEKRSLERKEWERIVSRIVSRETKPIQNRILALQKEIRKQRSRFRDILGGIGYILGIMGVVFFIKGRKQG